MASKPAMDRTVRALAITELVAASQTREEVDVLVRVGLRAGFLWRCPECGDAQFTDRDTCCGRPRPTP